MELNIIKQIKSLRNLLRQKPKDVVEVKKIKRELSSLRPVITRNQAKRKPIIVEIDGREMTLKEIAIEYDLHIKTVEARYRVGNRGRLLTRPSQMTYSRWRRDK